MADIRFWVTFAASLTAALMTFAGILVIRRAQEWGRRNSTYFICFASGVLITASLAFMFPKSISMNPRAPLYMVSGYFFLHLFNRFLTAYVCEKDPEKDYAFGVIPMLGIGFHSFLDGFIYSITFTVSLLTGGLAALGMVLHEFPEGVITYLLLVRGGFSEKTSFILALLAAALTTPLGMLISYPWIHQLQGPVLGALLSLAAGALIYTGATHLLPQAEKEPQKFSLIALGAGIAVATIIVLSKR